MSNELTLQQAQGMLPAQSRSVGAVADRAVAEIQAQVFMAKQFPRDENQARARILRACQRQGLAEKAIYTYPKGGQRVTGPSIRLAEAIAQAWGNLDFNTVILEQRETESVCLSYCWDVETNTRASRSFIVPHKIATKHGEKVLTDPREIYELAANQGARRLRACILSIIPGDIVDEAIDACNATLSGGNKRPLIDRLRELTDRFMTYHSVPLSSIERYFGYPLDSFTEMDGVTLAGIYTALRDGAASREDYFQMPKLTAGDDDKTTDKTDDAPKKAGKKQVKMDDL
jgi:hypothetical protein